MDDDTLSQLVSWASAIKASLLKEKWSKAYINDLPDSAFLFIESGGSKDGEGKTTPRDLRHLPYKDANGKVDLPHVRNAISRAGSIKLQSGDTISEGKANSLKAKAQKILSANTKDILSNGQVSLYKENGVWRTLGIFSNNWIDKTEDIITAAAHKRFVDMVDSGEYARVLKESILYDLPVSLFKDVADRGTPDYWLWHIPVPIGYVEMLAYDEASGAVIHAGRQKEGDLYSKIFQKLSQIENLGMSHMMPKEFLLRDTEDSRQIMEYLSTELTFLPRDEAANRGTAAGAAIFTKEDSAVDIPEKKVQWLEEKFGGDVVKAFDEFLGDLALAISEINPERKELDMGNTEEQAAKETVVEQETVTQAETQATEVSQANEAEEKKETDAQEQPAADNPEMITKAMFESLKNEIVEGVSAVANQLRKEFDDQIGQLRQELSTVKVNQQEAVTKALEETPPASMRDLMITSIADRKGAELKEGDPLNQQVAPQTPAPEKTSAGSTDYPMNGLSGFTFIDERVKRQREAVASGKFRRQPRN